MLNNNFLNLYYSQTAEKLLLSFAMYFSNVFIYFFINKTCKQDRNNTTDTIFSIARKLEHIAGIPDRTCPAFGN